MLADDSSTSILIVLLVIAGLLAGSVIARCVYFCWVDTEADEQKREEKAIKRFSLALQEENRQFHAKSLRRSRESAIQLYQRNIPAGALKELERRLKQSHLMFTRNGELLSIRVVGVPSGWIAIEWVLDPSLRQPRWVKGRRGPTVVFREYAYRGMFTDILEPGEECEFSLRVYDDDVEVDCVRFTIKIPSTNQWNRSFKALPDTTTKREREFQRLLPLLIDKEDLDEPRGYEAIDALIKSDVERKYFKARLDLELEIEREKRRR